MNILSKMYGGSLKPSDPRRFLVEAMVGAMQADGVVSQEELDTLDRNLLEHEFFGSLSPERTKMLVELAKESIAFAGGGRRRIPHIAKGLPSRSHRMAAYMMACEIAIADGVSAPEEQYLADLATAFLLASDESNALLDAVKKKRGMTEVEARTRQLHGLMPSYLECMALMASADGVVTAEERSAMLGLLRRMGDTAALDERELSDLVDTAFRNIAGKDPGREIGRVSRALDSRIDRCWAAVYAMIMAIADGKTAWRDVFFLGAIQEAMQLSDQDMDLAMASALQFPVGRALAS